MSELIYKFILLLRRNLFPRVPPQNFSGKGIDLCIGIFIRNGGFSLSSSIRQRA